MELKQNGHQKVGLSEYLIISIIFNCKTDIYLILFFSSQVKDGVGSLTFNPGLDVGLGLKGSLYHDSTPTITFPEHSREGQRHKQTVAVSLKMTPERHVSKETHFKIPEEYNAPKTFDLTSSGSDDVNSDVDAQNNNENGPIEFENDVIWYSSTLRMMPHALAHQCTSTLFVYPRVHAQKMYHSCIEFYVEGATDEGLDDEGFERKRYFTRDFLEGDKFREKPNFVP